MSNRKGTLFVISGPSGSGKSSVCGEISRKLDIPCSVSATTRPPRKGERDGVNYIFLTPEEFRARAEKGWFFEHAEVYGHLYGTPREPLEKAISSGRSVLLDVDVQGARSVRERCRNAVLIFVAPPDEDELRRRLEKRGTESREDMRTRLSKAQEENRRRGDYDYIVVNRDLSRAVEEVAEIMESEMTDGREI